MYLYKRNIVLYKAFLLTIAYNTWFNEYIFLVIGISIYKFLRTYVKFLAKSKVIMDISRLKIIVDFDQTKFKVISSDFFNINIMQKDERNKGKIVDVAFRLLFFET